MDSSNAGLSTLQRELLDAFFARTQAFFLTGGAALAEYYLHHRDTKDLDLFATPDANIVDGTRVLLAAGAAIGATVTPIQESVDFKRFSAERGAELTLVDLAIDRAPQLAGGKAQFGHVRVDTAREIAANKLCALLDRSEPRDLFDLQLLLASGIGLETVLADAQRKHAGADPATLAWVLSTAEPGPEAAIPAGTSAEELDEFREDLIARLTPMALPPG